VTDRGQRGEAGEVGAQGMMLCTKHCASRIEFAWLTTYCALGQAGRPSPSPDTPGRSTLRSLSEATNYDQPRARTLLGVLFYGDALQLLLQLRLLAR